ncbi:MAG: DUF4340 domain-containing protein [Deltaproteobacteria bacterium]|nr:DUF4340 domain-containing protein [Deltaproteobacteria bacterium]
MKRYRGQLVLAIIVASLGGYTLWDKFHATSADLEARRRNVWRAFHRERVDRIEVTHASGRYELVRRAQSWSVRSGSVARPADAVEVERALSEIEGAEASRTLGPLDADSKRRFGLDAPHTTVVVHEGPEVTARFSLGGAVEREDKVYVEAGAQEGGRDAARTGVVLGRSFAELFDRMSTAYRDRAVADIDPSRLDQVTVTHEARRISMARTGGVWRLTEPSWGRASRGAVEAMTSQLRELRAERVIADEADAATLRRYGLEPPTTRVEMRRGAIEPVVLRLGEPCPGHDAEVTATREGTGTVVCFSRSFADALRVPPEGLRDDRVMAARTDEVSRVRVSGGAPGGAELVLSRTGSNWTATPSGIALDPEALESWLTSLHDIAAAQRLDGDARAAHGIGPGSRTLTIEREGVEGSERIVIGTADATGFYVSRDDEPVVLRFAPSAAETLVVDALRFRPRALLHDTSDDLRALLLDVGAMHEEIIRTEDGFRLSRPLAYRADPALVTDLGRQLATLEVERWVRTTPLPEHGLAAPRARVVARFEGRGVPSDGGVDASVAPVRTYALTVGASAPGGGAYAALDGGPGVFVLPRSLVELITQSHLDRSAALVPREELARLALRFSSPARTVTLVRDGERWRTDSGAPADDARVDALLGTLSAMGAPRAFAYGPPGPEMGFAAPTVVVEASYGGDAGARSVRVAVGARYGSGEEAGYYLRRDGLDATLSWPESVIDALRGFSP